MGKRRRGLLTVAVYQDTGGVHSLVLYPGGPLSRSDAFDVQARLLAVLDGLQGFLPVAHGGAGLHGDGSPGPPVRDLSPVGGLLPSERAVQAVEDHGELGG